MFDDENEGEGHISLADIITANNIKPPRQFYAHQAIAYAIIDDALGVVLRHQQPRTKKRTELFFDTVRWISNDDTSWIFSFVNCCELIHLDSSYLRKIVFSRMGVVALSTRKNKYGVSWREYGEILKKMGKPIPENIPRDAGQGTNKYNAKKVYLHGFVFDSKAEAGYYMELRYLLCAGRIAELHIHTRFPLLMPTVKGNRIVSYRVTYYEDDFDFVDLRTNEWVVVDVKSNFTAKLPAYREKKKRIEEQYGICIREIIR